MANQNLSLIAVSISSLESKAKLLGIKESHKYMRNQPEGNWPAEEATPELRALREYTSYSLSKLPVYCGEEALMLL